MKFYILNTILYFRKMIHLFLPFFLPFNFIFTKEEKKKKNSV